MSIEPKHHALGDYVLTTALAVAGYALALLFVVAAVDFVVRALG